MEGKIGWVERKDEEGNILQKIRSDQVKLVYQKRKVRFERGYCEVWTDDFVLMYGVIDKEVTCSRIGFLLVPYLMQLSEFDTGDILVDQTEIAKIIGVHRQQVNLTLREFVKLGLLKFVRKQSCHNVYRLPETVVWKGRSEKRLKLIESKSKFLKEISKIKLKKT